MLSDSSANRWIERLESGDELAAQRLWEVFFDRLVRLAHGRLQNRYKKTVDAEDIALSAFHSFCRGVANHRFPSLADHDGLWRLLVSITLHKVLHAIRHQDCQKRGGEFQELVGLDVEGDSLHAVNQLVSREPSPEFVAEITEQFERLLESLGDPELMKIATWKMEGLTNEEIATHAEVSVRTIERKVQLIRKTWIKLFVS